MFNHQFVGFLAMVVSAITSFGALNAEYNGVSYSTSGDIVLGEFTSQFSKAKAYSEKSNIPLFVYWGNRGCHYCNEMEGLFASQEFKQWAAEKQLVMVFCIGTDDADAVAAKAYAKNSSGYYPYVSIAWGDEQLCFSGRMNTMPVRGLDLFDSLVKSVQTVIKGYAGIGSKDNPRNIDVEYGVCNAEKFCHNAGTNWVNLAVEKGVRYAFRAIDVTGGLASTSLMIAELDGEEIPVEVNDEYLTFVAEKDGNCLLGVVAQSEEFVSVQYRLQWAALKQGTTICFPEVVVEHVENGSEEQVRSDGLAVNIVPNGAKVIPVMSVKGATIHYTEDGTNPTLESRTLDSDGVQVNAKKTISFVAVVDGYLKSQPAVASFALGRCQEPLINYLRPTGSYGPQDVSIVCFDEGAEIRYSIGDPIVSEKSILYNGSFTVEESATVYAKVFKPNWIESATAELYVDDGRMDVSELEVEISTPYLENGRVKAGVAVYYWDEFENYCSLMEGYDYTVEYSYTTDASGEFPTITITGINRCFGAYEYESDWMADSCVEEDGRLWFYNATENGCRIVACSDANGILRVPASLNGLAVTSIDEGFMSYSFGQDLLDVIIPSSVREIGEGAFSGFESDIAIITFEGLQPNENCCVYIDMGIGEDTLVRYDPQYRASWVNFAEEYHEKIVAMGEPLPDGLRYYEQQGGYIWKFSVEGGEAILGANSPWGGSYYGGSVDPWPTGEVAIPETLGGRPVTGIGYYALAGCGEIESLELPVNLTQIQYGAFDQCWKMRRVKLPVNLLCIGPYAFSGCSSLALMTIPGSVVGIGTSAFAGCNNLKRIFFEGNAPQSIEGDVYSQTSEELVSYVRLDSVGWESPESSNLPDVWPIDCGCGMEPITERPIRIWATYPTVAWKVTFELGRYGTRIGGGELSQSVNDGSAAVEPRVETVNGVRLIGWSCGFTCVEADLTVYAIYADEKGVVLPRLYVGFEGSDDNNGSSEQLAFRSIQKAIDCAADGDVIEVDDGIYGPIRVSDGDKHLLIRSKHGASFTSIDGGGISRCATLGNTTNVVLQGFSVCNGHIDALSSDGVSNEGAGVWGGVLVDCVVSNNEVAYFGSPYWAYGGGASRSTLKRCVIAGNRVSAPMGVCGGGAYECVLENCLVVGNMANSEQEAYGGGAAWSELYNCTVVDNVAESLYAGAYGGGCYLGTASNTIACDNLMNGSDSWYWSWNFYYSTDLNCFDGTYEDPQFVDPENGDYRLSAVSPCVDAGCNDRIRGETDLIGECRVQNGIVDIGAYEGGYVVPPTMPGDLSATEEKAGSIELSWAASRFAEGYVIYRANRNSFAKASQIATTAEAAFEDYDVNSDYTYYYWVCATNAYAQSEMSDSVSGTCTDPISVLTIDADLSGAVEMEPFSIQLSANGGVSPYVWTGTLPGYYIERTSSTFKECGKPRGLRKMSVEADYVLPFDFVLADGRASPYVHFSSDGWLEIRSNSTLWDYEMLASFDLSGGNWLVATEPTDDVYVDEESDIVTFRWQRKFGDDVSMAANFSISLCRDGRVVAKYGDGNDLIDTMQYGIGDDCWGEVEVSAFCDDIALTPIGMPPGLDLSDDGMLSGTPLKPGAYQFVVQAEGETGGTGYKWLTINVAENANKRPFVSATPDAATVKVMVGEGKTFSVDAQDPEGAELTYRWIVDGEELENDTSAFRYEPTLEDDVRHHTIECWVADDLWQDDNATRVKWDVDVFRTLRVDIERGLAFPEDEESPEPDGSGERPYKYLEDAMSYAGFGDVIEVGPGSHCLSWVNEGVLVKSTNGRAVTFIESELGESIGGDRYSGSAIEGFTFVNYVVEGLVIRDSIVRGVKSDWGYAVSDCELIDCIVCGNVCDDYVVQYSKLTNCTIADNKSVNDGGIIGCDVSNSIVWDNQGQDGNVVNYYEPEDVYDYDGLCIFENSCVWPIQVGGGNTQDDPLFVDPFWHDYRLRAGSSAVGMGAGFLDHDVKGIVFSARISGNGDVEPHTVVVSPGGSASFTVAKSIRPLVCFSVGEAKYEGVQSITIDDIQNDGIITAVFSNYTFYVDATHGDDSNDGLSKEKALTSIQPALDRALNGEKIVVSEGVYAPITGFGRKVEVVAVDGAEKTIIDAGMSCNSCSCANLGSRERASNEPGAYGDWYGTNTVLRGFTLTGGFDLLGGGAIGGTLEDCIIMGNVATVYGGGVFASVCRRCLIVDNCVEYDGNYYLVLDQYLWQMEKWRYRKHKGEYDPEDWDYGYFVGGGGAFGAELYNCTVVNNDVLGDDVALFGYGALHCRSDHAIIIGNYGEDCEFPIANVGCVLAEDDDPMFADPDNGDFRLRCDSPYVVNGVATVGCYSTPFFDLPGVPMNVAATEDEPCQIVISWDAAEFAEAYLVYRATKNSFAKSECIAEVRDCFFVDRPADIIPEYYYWVQGKNMGGVGEVSDAALGWCDIDKEPEEADNPVYDPSSENYNVFCEWAVSNGLIEVESAAYPAQVRSAALALDAKGEPVWADFIAGTDPADKDDVFKIVDARFENGEFKITWSPDLNENGTKSIRKYTTYGCSELGGEWLNVGEVSNPVKDSLKFFKVDVRMK